MSNKEELLWCIHAGIPILLFLTSSMDLITKGKKVGILPISVIIEDASDNYYINFKKGMEMAAEKFHGDVSFITLYVTNDQERQMELAQREVCDGAKAIILSSVNETETMMALDVINPSCPIVLLGAPMPSESVVDTIAAGNFRIGQIAARAVAVQAPSDVSVYLFTEGLSYGDNINVYDRTRSVLDGHGSTYRLVEKRTDDTCRQAIEETVYPGDGRITVIALDAQLLNEINQIVDGSTVYQAHVAGLYGVGSTASILGRLNRGTIDGSVAYNQFDMGYLSVKRVVEAVQGSRQGKQMQLDAVYVNKEDTQDR